MRTDLHFREVNVQALPKEFDVFWEKYLNASHGLIASRNAEVIKWYYMAGFRNLDKRVFTYTLSGQIVGYASLVEEPVANSKIKRYKIVDILATDIAVKSALLKSLLKFAYSIHADLVEVHIPGMINRDEIPAITLKRIAPYVPCYYQTNDAGLNEVLEKFENWHISSYDGDSCLF